MGKKRSAKPSISLHDLVFGGTLAEFRAALSSGADVNELDPNGSTPLLIACRVPAPSADFVRALLDNGADPNIADEHGRTPLHEIVQGTISRSAMAGLPSPFEHFDASNVANLLGAIMVASTAVKEGEVMRSSQFDEIVQLLLDKGANPSAKDKRGATPAILAARDGAHDLMEKLIQAGSPRPTETELAAEYEPVFSDPNGEDEVYFQLHGESDIRFSVDDSGRLFASFSFGYDEEELGKSFDDCRISIRCRFGTESSWREFSRSGRSDEYRIEFVGPKLQTTPQTVYLAVEAEGHDGVIDLGEVEFK